MNGYSINYPAPDYVPLSWTGTSEKRDAAEKAAEKMDGGVLYEIIQNEYILQYGFNLFHVRFDRDMGSCACDGFEYNSAELAVPCKHIIRVRNILANETDKIKPLDPRIAKMISAHIKDQAAIQDDKTVAPEGAQPPAPPTTEPEYTFICSSCKTGIQTEQRNASYERHKRALCVDCESKLTGSSEPKKEEKQKKSYLCQGGQHKDCGGHDCGCPCHSEKPSQEKKEPEKKQSEAPKDHMQETYDEARKERLPSPEETAKEPEVLPMKKPITDAELSRLLEEKEKKQLAQIPHSELTTEVIKTYICPNATEVEAYTFLQLCKHRNLNPFLREAYLIKYGNAPATMVVGKDAFTRKAEESGKLDGFEAGIIVQLSEGSEYNILDDRVGTVLIDGETLIGGWAKVYRKDMQKPFECRVSIKEYQKFNKEGRLQQNWQTMPATMIRKVALVNALREAFTGELGGMYDPAEMGAEA